MKLGSSPSACILWPVAGQKKFQWSKLRSMICMVGVLGFEGGVGQSIEEVAPFSTGDVLMWWGAIDQVDGVAIDREDCILSELLAELNGHGAVADDSIARFLVI